MSTPAHLDPTLWADRAAEQAQAIQAALNHLYAYAADLQDRSAMLSARSTILCEQSAMLRAQSKALRAAKAAYGLHRRQARARIYPFP